MPVWLNHVSRDHIVFRTKGDDHWRLSHTLSPSAGCINLGLINNMPDAALKSTERQVIELLDVAAGRVPIRMRLYALPSIPRTDWARQHLSGLYSDIGDLWIDDLDGIIVTGTEPRASNLAEEPYWNTLREIIDWAAENTVSTIWSCLAAHGVVLQLDGINRRRLSQKCVGVFTQQRIMDHALMQRVPSRLRIPHSRWNGIDEESLVSSGYSVLTRSTNTGVDTFLKQQKNSLFVLFQGHPEYDSKALLREYRRDIGRYLRGEIDFYPTMPRRYFDDRTEASLTAFRERALSDRRSDVLARFPLDPAVATVKNTWRLAAARMYRNWILYICARKRRTRANPGVKERSATGRSVSSH